MRTRFLIVNIYTISETSRKNPVKKNPVLFLTLSKRFNEFS